MFYSTSGRGCCQPSIFLTLVLCSVDDVCSVEVSGKPVTVTTSKGNNMNVMKKLLGWVILFAVAVFVFDFAITNVHHLVVFAVIVFVGVFAFVKLTGAKQGPLTRRVKRFLVRKFSK